MSKERLSENIPCATIGRIQESEGSVGIPKLLDLYIGRNNKIYSITVATPEHIASIHEANAATPDPQLRQDTNIFPLDDLSDIQKICKRLTSEIPYGELEPFLHPIKTSEENE